jgi:hypothetical protein
MRLSDIKGEKALDAMADLIDPLAEIAQNKILVGLIRKKNYKEAVKIGLKQHKKAVLTILAILNQQDVETYEPTLAEIPKMLLDLFNDKELLNLFSSQAEQTNETSSSSAMVNIGASEN